MQVLVKWNKFGGKDRGQEVVSEGLSGFKMGGGGGTQRK